MLVFDKDFYHRDTEIFKRINRDVRINRDNKKIVNKIPVYPDIPVNFFLCG
jgi:hypothetical protein